MAENIKFYYYGVKCRKCFEPNDIPARSAEEKYFSTKIYITKVLQGSERIKIYITKVLQGWGSGKFEIFVLRNVEMTPK